MRYTVNGRRVSRKTFMAAAGGAGLLVVALFCTLVLGSLALTAWLLMLILGGLHHSVWEAVPALGFWPSFLVVLALNFLSSLFKR